MAPLTRGSPRPWVASMTRGWWVNTTPETSASMNRWTSTAIAGGPLAGVDWWSRQAMARGDRSEAQHRATAAATAWVPRTAKMVSCCPAPEEWDPSSVVLEERTATNPSLSLIHI